MASGYHSGQQVASKDRGYLSSQTGLFDGSGLFVNGRFLSINAISHALC